jgi:hypothetical protein
MLSWSRGGPSAAPWGGPEAIEVVLEDRGDRAVGEAVDLESPGAGRLEAIGAVAFAQADDAETGAEALFGMRLLLEDGRDQEAGLGADGVSLALQAFVGPAGVAPMGARHVLGYRAVAPVLEGAQVCGDAPAAMEQLDGLGGDPGADRLADQLMRHRVVVLGDLDVIVDADPALLPLGELVALDRQAAECRLVELTEQFEAALAEVA